MFSKYNILINNYESYIMLSAIQISEVKIKDE